MRDRYILVRYMELSYISIRYMSSVTSDKHGDVSNGADRAGPPDRRGHSGAAVAMRVKLTGKFPLDVEARCATIR